MSQSSVGALANTTVSSIQQKSYNNQCSTYIILKTRASDIQILFGCFSETIDNITNIIKCYSLRLLHTYCDKRKVRTYYVCRVNNRGGGIPVNGITKVRTSIRRNKNSSKNFSSEKRYFVYSITIDVDCDNASFILYIARLCDPVFYLGCAHRP